MNFNSELLGEHAADVQNRLAARWFLEGPDPVFEEVSRMTSEQLVELVMLNVGAQAINTLR